MPRAGGAAKRDTLRRELNEVARPSGEATPSPSISLLVFWALWGGMQEETGKGCQTARKRRARRLRNARRADERGRAGPRERTSSSLVEIIVNVALHWWGYGIVSGYCQDGGGGVAFLGCF